MLQAQQPRWLLILILMLIKILLPYLLQDPTFELQRDEFLYYQQGQHLAWGYMENPPLIAWLARLSAALGGTEFWIKWWTVFFGALTVMLTCLIAAAMGGRWWAQLLAGMGIIAGAYLRVHFLFQPNFLDFFCCTLALYFLIRLVQTGKDNYCYALVAALVLGWYSKYSVLFIAVAIVAGILCTPQRKRLLQIKTVVALLVALLLVAPNVWWQYSHNWPLLHHMQELQDTQLKFMKPGDFLKDQLLMNLSIAVLWLAGLVYIIVHKAYRYLALVYVLVLLLLILGRGKSYYALGVYPMLVAAGAVAWQQLSGKRQWLMGLVAVVVVFFVWVVLPMSLPIWPPQKLAAFYKEKNMEAYGLLKWEDQQNHALPQDFADMLGWKEMAAKTYRVYNQLPDTIKAQTVIYARHYGQAGSLQLYNTDTAFVKRVISDNGSFLLWIPPSLRFKHLLFVGHRMPGADDEVFQHFETVAVMDSITNTLSRQYGDRIIFFKNIDAAGLQLATDGLKQMKKEFGE